MYFNNKKEDTNIDSEFKDNKKIDLDFSKINLKKLDLFEITKLNISN